MLAEFRAGTFSLLAVELAGVPLWDEMPDDINELPCVVVARPGCAQTATRVVFDLALEVFVIGRRQSAGGSESELTLLADRVFAALGGTRGAKTATGETVAVTRVRPRTLSIAGADCPAYSVEVEASATTC